MLGWLDSEHFPIIGRLVIYMIVVAVILWRTLWGADPIEGSKDRPTLSRRRIPHDLPHYTLGERLAMLDDLRDREVIGPGEYVARRQRILESGR